MSTRPGNPVFVSLHQARNLSCVDEPNLVLARAYNYLTAEDYRRARELFEQIHDGNNIAIARCLGFIHAQRESSEYDLQRSISYYEVGAAQDDIYSYHALGGLMMECGSIDRAIDCYTAASNRGDAECSYNLYLIFKRKGDEQSANAFFERAAEQGHALGIHRLAFKHIKGERGLRKIPSGFRMLCRNLPNLMRYAKQHAPR